jgi:hypothetical protein
MGTTDGQSRGPLPVIARRTAGPHRQPTVVVAGIGALAFLALASCSDDARTATTPVAATTGSTLDSTDVASTERPRPGAVPNVAGDGGGPSVEDQLAAATIPPVPEDCRSADVDAVTAVIGTEVAFTIGQLDPSGRSLCRYVDADEVTLVRVRVTEATGDPTADDSFAALSADPTAVVIDDGTIQVGRLAARLDRALIEVTVESDAVADDASAADAAVSLLAVVAE